MTIARIIALALLASTAALHAQGASPVTVSVILDPETSTSALAGRLLVFMTNNLKPLEVITPGFGDQANNVWIAAKEVKHWCPGDTVEIDVDDIAWPRPLSAAPQGTYQVMALLDVDHNAAYTLLTSGDVRSKVVSTENLRSTPLRLTEPVKEPSLSFAGDYELIDFESPVLSKFWGRTMRMAGVVLLPADYRSTRVRYPTVYVTHGFGGGMKTEFPAVSKMIKEETDRGNLPPLIWVLLDESLPTGTHEFVDSVNNGPWGQALTAELIPHLERKYRMDAKPSGRLLNGHSSGGWATLWLQVAYPDLFGGAWPTSPDPVDFRDFTNIDIYADRNAFRRDGQPVPLIREEGRTTQNLDEFAKWEMVVGEYGGQWSSFEWVFSPRGPDGRPLLLFDRTTGEIDRNVAEHWRRFDIGAILTRQAKELAPKLKGKMHIVVGTQDTFFLDEPVRLLQQRIEGLGYDAKFTYLEGRTHFDLYDGGLLSRITQQMYAVARPKAKWVPKVAPGAATELVR